MNYVKTILLALLGKYAKVHAKEIAKAQKWIDSAQTQFTNAIEEAEIAENKFNDIAKRKQEQIDKMLEELNEASKNARSAETFKNKIKKFIEE